MCGLGETFVLNVIASIWQSGWRAAFSNGFLARLSRNENSYFVSAPFPKLLRAIRQGGLCGPEGIEIRQPGVSSLKAQYYGYRH